ncbi:hypothetical protein WN943_023565 [Citrus x changshan-huyou]
MINMALKNMLLLSALACLMSSSYPYATASRELLLKHNHNLAARLDAINKKGLFEGWSSVLRLILSRNPLFIGETDLAPECRMPYHLHHYA